MIRIPENAEITEWPTSTSWYDENGIMYSVYKKGASQTMEEARATVETFKQTLNGKKICLLADVTHTSQSSRETREYLAEELPKFIKAIAMVSDSSLGKMLANLFLTLKTQPYPTRMFNSEKEARDWLQQYL